MSGTRSHFPKAPATSRAAILVSHGQPSQPEVAEAELSDFCAQVVALLTDWSVVSATMANPGAISKALQLSGPNPLIYPVFMTDGWFTQTALPERFVGTQARILPPLGVDPLLVPLAACRLQDELHEKGWMAEETCLIVAAHGSGRSRNSARNTQVFTKALQTVSGFGDLRVGFIEEEPHLSDVLTNAGGQSVCLPFFATKRDHVLGDLPAAIKQADFKGLCLDPVGLDPSIPRLIADGLIAANAKEVAA